ncbi:MAG: [Fe-Fe] hydrogenase large subunit C-terminal domain-containing protein [Anaerolineae bacterium]
MPEWVVATNLARCRDCYLCVRTCSVKAVRVQNGQAQVVPELCIACGSCVRACPQKAKAVREDRGLVEEALRAGCTVVASIAPSAPAFFHNRTLGQLEEPLKRLGFTAAGETAFGAEMVGLAHKDLVDTDHARWPVITSSCPVVVNLIERYYPDLIEHLAPIVSPMLAHGRWLRQRYGEDAFVVFIGPCIAKKAEADDSAVAGVVDAVLTFTELDEWLAQEGIQVTGEGAPALAAPRANARAFPVEGGLVGTALLDTDILTSHIVTTSGLSACEDVLRGIRLGKLDACLVELMACEGGCINGPVMEGRVESVFLARQRVLEYASQRQSEALPMRAEWPSLERGYSNRHVVQPSFSEEQVREVLHRVDKYAPEDELNCGACGYPTCRDKAVATLRGMAEATMCIPYMRHRAESLRQVLMDVTPNPVIIVDNRLILHEISPSAEQLFRRRRQDLVGKPLAQLLPIIDSFVRARDTGPPILNETGRLSRNLIVEQNVVPVGGQNLLVGILRDVTERVRQHDELEHIRTETLSRTQEVVKNQMRVAQEIAQLLGETTAETKMMVSRLAKLLEEGQDA